MSIIDLNELARRESERVEWKENVADIVGLIKTIVAFSNDFSNLGGGYVVCGAAEGLDEYGFPKVSLHGITANRIKEITGKVLSDCREKVDPGIIPIVEELPVPGDESKRILVFIVPASGNAHSYRTSGKDSSTYYIRSGSNTIEARNGVFRELMLKKRRLEPWDRRINDRASIDDLDLLILRESLKEMNLLSTHKTLEEYVSDKEKLSDFVPPLVGRKNLDPTLKLRNFTVLMFGKKPLDFFDGAYSLFSIYKGQDRSEPTGERFEITGTIVQQAKRLIELLNAESYIAFDKLDSHPNQVKYPERALKEAVVNALVHRDYESDQPVRVTVFSDRIEIFSPGSLPTGIDQEKFKAGKASALWRNQALNYLCVKLQLAQAEGQGIPTILKTMKDEGCPPPDFEIGPESVTCILPAHPRHRLLRDIGDVENKIVLRNYQEAYHKLEEILNKDIYNYRALELFCQVNTSLDTPLNVYRMVTRHNLDLDKINSNTLIMIAQTCASIPKSEGVDTAEFTKSLLKKVSSGKLEEKQIIDIAYQLRKLGENEKAVQFINDELDKRPGLGRNSSLLQHRARARIDLAKICEQSFLDPKHNKKIKDKALVELKRYMIDAEKDLDIALENSVSSSEKEWILRDMQFLNDMKNAILETDTN